MHPFRVFCTLSALACLAATPVLGQYTLKKIVFNGATPYTQAALEAASGLKSGDHVSNDTLPQAAQRLSDTGAFGDLQVSFDGPVNAISIIFKITPLDSLAGQHSELPALHPQPRHHPRPHARRGPRRPQGRLAARKVG